VTATPAEVARLVGARRYGYNDEVSLHALLAEVLEGAGMTVRREVRLTPRDRIDLLVDTVGVEVKVANTPVDNLEAQCKRYLRCPEVESLVVVTTRSQHRALPLVILGQHVHVVYLGGP